MTSLNWLTTALAIGLLAAPVVSMAQYTQHAAQNKITETRTDGEGKIITNDLGDPIEYEVAADSYGNAQGDQYDLAQNGAFKGKTIAVLHLYTGEGFDFSLPGGALASKGFDIHRWTAAAPPVQELEEVLSKSCQFWLISTKTPKLTDEHIQVIKKFFDAGHGVYIWGDNQPYYTDANKLSEALIGASMTGSTAGGQNVGLDMGEKVGIQPNHLLSTGLQNVYEGVTIATIGEHQELEPLIYGSASNLVTAVYEKDGKRLIIDGGFTRLYLGWETAGTARYIKNAGAWLAHVERFPIANLGNE